MNKILILVFPLILLSVDAFACSSCFGDPNSTETKGIQYGIWLLLGVVFSILACFGSIFFRIAQRTKGINHA